MNKIDNNNLRNIIEKKIKNDNLNFKKAEEIYIFIFKFIRNILYNEVTTNDFKNYNFKMGFSHFMRITNKKINNQKLIKNKKNE